MKINILVPGEPKPQGRPKFARRGNFVTAYDAKPSKEYKKLVSGFATRQYNGQPIEDAINVKLDVFRPLQKSISKVERERRLSGQHRPVVKGDIDNYFKAVTDACTGIVWKDDAQIVSTQVNKYYSDRPRVEMIVTTLDEES